MAQHAHAPSCANACTARLCGDMPHTLRRPFRQEHNFGRQPAPRRQQSADCKPAQGRQRTSLDAALLACTQL
eukprot:5128028-Pleurochrysis_carterae.AAC.1